MHFLVLHQNRIATLLSLVLPLGTFYVAYFLHRKEKGRPLPRYKWIMVLMICLASFSLFMLGVMAGSRAT
jgi:phosphoglycerol transferase MdoB-like AlkP superfamily enzyme